ncbi:glycerol-3-phosphate dehydrogenase/oxidase [Bailinhaonella thermotolerans]|uniref:Glycerol-3-phosphate dehydrogenase n=1 Tax=Bailinhaonella thermotolerans TaxID=1070861 RepID=A0A3A4AV05_9ACTN|nr:glycerol-3-phosphate dehydrogenase/oxidase [Bailinhaonella thermotolerans]RJL33435.1 glycerol-3-phosphate dehydrogenase/oxidase [Bailinhaonella thermotolerans]
MALNARTNGHTSRSDRNAPSGRDGSSDRDGSSGRNASPDRNASTGRDGSSGRDGRDAAPRAAGGAGHIGGRGGGGTANGAGRAGAGGRAPGRVNGRLAERLTEKLNERAARRARNDHRRDQLGPAQRAGALRALRDERFDLVVVGGGVTGTGIALDAATRGLSVALVEAVDWAAGTSSRSSKLVHGGLRYLEQFDFGLVREALRERALLLDRIAPHLVRPVRFLYPLTRRGWERAYVGAGVRLYDSLGGAGAVPRHRHLSRRRALEEAPGLRPDTLVGAIQYYDAQVDDARLTMTLARTAARYGAVVATGLRVEGFLRDGERFIGVRLRDAVSGEPLVVEAGHVVNATGTWTGGLLALAGVESPTSVRASKGVHIVVPRDRVDLGETGLIARTERSVLFVIPWGAHWLIGTTDTPWEHDATHPAASRADVDYLLDQCNRVLASPLTREDVVGVYAGLRPLVDTGAAETTKLSREHVVWQPAPGLTAIAGGKMTTYRVMARDAVDAVVGPAGPRSRTHEIPLVGADGVEVLRQSRRVLARRARLPEDLVGRLLERYGSTTLDLLDLIAARPALAAPLDGAPHHIAAEIVYAASHEGAMHLVDALARRTHIAVDTADRGLSAAPGAARLMAEVLGWDRRAVAREVEHYQAVVAAERLGEAQAEEAAAFEARMAVPDPRLVAAPVPVRRLAGVRRAPSRVLSALPRMRALLQAARP